jgi:hypothetical protein
LNRASACGKNFKERSEGGVKTPYLALRIQDEEDLKVEAGRKMDEFLDVYSFYLSTRVSWVLDEVRLKAYELHMIDPSFQFQI